MRRVLLVLVALIVLACGCSLGRLIVGVDSPAGDLDVEVEDVEIRSEEPAPEPAEPEEEQEQ